jgi:outer membrane protein assembly factor BamB
VFGERVNNRYIFTFAVLFISMVIFFWWQLGSPVDHLTKSVPGLDNKPQSLSGISELIKIGEGFDFFSEEKTSSVHSWPRFRGENFDNIATEKISIRTKWDSNYPKELWKVDLGEGHAAPAIYTGKVYLLDYDEAKKADALRCFNLENGKELWRRWYRVNVKRNHGMSRTIPAVSNNCVVTIGPRCHVMCTNSENGDFLWGIDVERNYKTEVPFWYTGQCPIIDGNMVVIAVGGDKLMIGVDLKTGKIIWETRNDQNFKMSHSSIMPMTIHGKKMYVYCAIGGIIGISAGEGDLGKLLWTATKWKPSVIAPSPVLLKNNRIFASAGYGAGSILFEIVKSGTGFSANILQQIKPNEGIASEQQTPILYKGLLYGILPKDAGPLRNEFVCSDPADLTKILWSSGTTNRFGLGPYILIDNKFLILNDDGDLFLAEEKNNKFTLVARKKVLRGHDAWGPFALTDGKLLLRDSKQMVCIDFSNGL